jgi:hypothetical protein
MDVTLTLFKKSGSKEDDIFTGTFAGPEDHPGEWYLLTSDSELIASGMKFVVVEFSDVKALPNGYATKVKRTPHLDIRYKDNYSGSLGYPRGSSLLAKDIKTWVLNFIKTIYPNLEPKVTIPDSVETETSTTRDVKTTTKKSIQPPKKITNSGWLWPSVAVGGVLVAAAGAFLGTQLLGDEEKDGIGPLLLVDGDDSDEEELKKDLRFKKNASVIVDTSATGTTKPKRSPSESSAELVITDNETNNTTWVLPKEQPKEQEQEEGEL